jgi:hypothetical protein
LFYKPNIDESVDRFQKLWAREAQDRILVKIDIQDPDNPTVMRAMAHVPDYKAMVDEWEKGFELNRGIEDDNLPIVYGELGGYILGAFLGADVTWGAGGAYSSKLILDMKNYRENLHFDEYNGYYKMQIDYLKYLSKRSQGRFGYTEMITIDGLNFLDCLRHGDAYTDLYDYPCEIKTIMAFGSDLNMRLVKEQRKYIETYRGGRFNFYQIWTPGETIFISVDAYGQCSSDIFEKFGREYVQRMIDEFNGGWLHVHSDAMRLLPFYVELDNLIAIGLEDWIKPPRAILNIDDIIEITGDIPLMINIERQEFLDMMDTGTLPGNTLYWVGGVTSAKDANMIAEAAYTYRSTYNKKYH